MKKINRIYTLLAVIVAILMVGCNGEEENFTWTPGTELMIRGGASQIATHNSTGYYVDGFTIDETYTWSISGTGQATATVRAGRDGEYVDVIIADAGAYTLSVSNDAGLEGSFDITASDVQQTVGFEMASIATVEGMDSLAIPVMITNRNLDETRVNFSIVADGAIEGVDYEVLTSSPLVFEAGQTTAVIYVNGFSNLTLDGDRNFTVNLTGIASTGAGNRGVSLYNDEAIEQETELTVTVMDNLKYVDIIADEAEIAVNQSGNLLLDFVMDKPSTQDVIVNYSVANVAGVTDLSGGSVIITAGTTSANIALSIGSNVAEDSEVLIELTSIVSVDEQVLVGESLPSVTLIVNI